MIHQEPLVSKPIVEWAEETYPDQCPALNTPDREIWYKAGQVSVVKKLRQLLEDQSTQVLP